MTCSLCWSTEHGESIKLCPCEKGQTLSAAMAACVHTQQQLRTCPRVEEKAPEMAAVGSPPAVGSRH